MGTVQGRVAPLSVEKRSYEEACDDLFDFTDGYTKSVTESYLIGQDGYLENHDGTLVYKNSKQPSSQSIMHVVFASPSRVNLQCLMPKISNSHKVWICPMQLPNLICQGDEIKIGKFQFRVTTVQTKGNQLEKSRVLRPSFMQSNFLVENSKISQCRFCFMRAGEGMQLVAPCKCTGSQQFIHLQCLRDWNNTKIVRESGEHFQFLSAPTLGCQVCGAAFKEEFVFENRKLPLIKYTIPNGPHIILTGSKPKDTNSTILVIKLGEGKEILVGREKFNHVKINDISISRTHCSLLLHNKGVYLTDKKSKFGTLLRPRTAQTVQGRISLQYNNSLMDVSSQLVSSSCWAQTPTEFQFSI